MRYHEGSDAEEMDRKDTVIDSTIHQYERRMDTLEEKFIEYASVVHSFLQTCLLVPYYLHATMVEFYGEEVVRLRLGDLGDPPSDESLCKLRPQTCNGNAVKCHVILL